MKIVFAFFVLSCSVLGCATSKSELNLDMAYCKKLMHASECNEGKLCEKDEETFAVKGESTSASKDSLLKRSHVSEALLDTSKNYEKRSTDSLKAARNENLKSAVWFAGYAVVGVFSLWGGITSGYWSKHQESSVKKWSGYSAGVFLTTLGVGFLLIDLIEIPLYLMQSYSEVEQAENDQKRENVQKLRISPTMNMQKLGGGILMKINF